MSQSPSLSPSTTQNPHLACGTNAAMSAALVTPARPSQTRLKAWHESGGGSGACDAASAPGQRTLSSRASAWWVACSIVAIALSGPTDLLAGTRVGGLQSEGLALAGDGDGRTNGGLGGVWGSGGAHTLQGPPIPRLSTTPLREQITTLTDVPPPSTHRNRSGPKDGGIGGAVGGGKASAGWSTDSAGTEEPGSRLVIGVAVMQRRAG